MSSVEFEVRRSVGLTSLRRRRFNIATRKVMRAGARPYSDIPRLKQHAALVRAERAQNAEVEALGDDERRAIAAIRDLAESRGIPTGAADALGPLPFAALVGRQVWAVVVPACRDAPELVVFPLDRIVRLD